MKFIRVEMSAYKPEKTIDITLEDLGISEEKWDSLNEDEKRTHIRDYTDNIEQPFWEIESVKEI